MNGMANARSHNRRGLLMSAFGGAILLLAGQAGIARAEPTTAPNQGPGELKSSCEKHGGVYIESKKDNVQACFWPNKGKTVCKYNGTGCYNYDPPKAATTPTGPFADPFGSVNWPELEALAEASTSTADEPATTPAEITPATIVRPPRRKRRRIRRKLKKNEKKS